MKINKLNNIIKENEEYKKEIKKYKDENKVIISEKLELN